METPYKTVKTKDKVLNIYQDNDNINDPREWDNLGTMICNHKRYSLGDKHEFDFNEYNNWDEAEKAIEKEYKTAIILPLYLYDHSGQTIRTTPFSCKWDSGQVGFIIISKETIRKEYNVKRINQKLIDRVTQYLINEVETYDQYITGDVYWFEVTDNEGERIDSCSGFYGDDFKTNGLCDYISEDLVELL